MKQDEQFDELARRKLEERSFPFEEADWTAARALIDTERGRTGGMIWPWWALGLLLAGGLAWYALADYGAARQPDKPVASVNVLPVLPEEVQVESEALRASDISTGSDVMPTRAEVLEEEHQVAPSSVISTHPTVEATTTVRQPATEDVAVTSQTAQPLVVEPETSTTRKSDEAASVSDRARITADHDLVQHTQAPPIQGEEHPVSESHAAPSSATPSGAGGEGTVQADPSVTTSPLSDEGSPASYSADTLAVSAPVTNSIAPADSISLSVLPPAQPHDSATAVELPPSLIPERAPWEISFLGGVFNSRSIYRGGGSADWADGSSPARSPAFGAELMHMGRHFGLGLGLHWGSYAERLRTDARREQVTHFDEHWTFVSFQTTILVITDTLPGAPPSYQGTSVDTILNVFMQVTDTLSEERVVRNARDSENRVSYLEVPLLADVHVVQGRWSLGLRGGPTVGLLTGRRGTMPNATDDGYVPYGDQTFRSLMLGYTARAYVRYRFNAGWSVGLEPAVRGQLLNSLDNDGLSKQSHASGLMLNLTYRLR